jgi:hypothetical protein
MYTTHIYIYVQVLENYEYYNTTLTFKYILEYKLKNIIIMS